ncbi:UNVERIFIED_CONTAM: hypothetical protein Sangu_2578900 [Sesamum angustifolium]|uniref:Uncharacterized protein n=2 Tax=Sesamum angustifolium TaxID=2727405 RepID=A0AAW2J9P2_9LAMI
MGHFQERIEGSVLALQYILACKGVPPKVEAFGRSTNQLVDFRVTSGSKPEKRKDPGKDKGKSGKVRKDKKFKKNKEVTGSGNKDTAQFSVDRTKKGCYLCKDDHRMHFVVAEMVRVDLHGSILCSCWVRCKKNHPNKEKLGLTLAQHSSRIKAVNSEVKPIQGVGTYLQDFIRSVEKKDTLMSALQEVLDEVAEVLEKFKDVFPPEFPKRLPLHRAIDHAIELEPGARPPAQAPYRMCPARSSWMGYWRQD